MIHDFLEFKNLVNEKDHERMNRIFFPLIQNFDFLSFSHQDDFPQAILSEIRKSNFIIVDSYSTSTGKYFILCFDEQLIFFEQLDQFYMDQLSKIFARKKKIYFLNSFSDDFLINEEKQNLFNNDDLHFNHEILTFSESFQLLSYKDELNNIFKIIRPCLSAYLIKKSYCKMNSYKLEDLFAYFEENIEKKERSFQKDEFIKLTKLGSGSASIVELWYHIKEGKLYAIKIQRDKQVYLIQRELNNYRNTCYPLFPKFYGTIKDNNDTFIVIEYISGRSLEKISEFHFTFEQKVSILCQLLFIFDYLHQNQIIFFLITTIK